MCRTYLVGDVADSVKTLVKASKEALDAAIVICGPGVDFRQIGKEIELYTKKNYPQLIVGEDFIGHGVGKNFHSAPWVFHFSNNQQEGTMKVCHLLRFSSAFVLM